ncbi:MAG: damage-control phosphatase ARMT1 family protein [Elusimicrobiota bacterium]
MEIQCAACFMKQALKAAQLSTSDFSLRLRAVKKAAGEIAQLNPVRTPPETATRIFKTVARETGCTDAFSSLKEKSNREVAKILPEIKKKLCESADPFSFAVKVSLCGNIIDYGILEEFDLPALLVKEIKETFLDGKIELLKSRVIKATSIVFLADNAGEIAFDSLMLEEFLKLNPNLNIIIFLKSGPIINDATEKDAEFFKIDRKFKIEPTAPVVGLHLNLLTDRQKNLLNKTDIIIAKGQANYEILSEKENKKVVYMLRAKCPVVAGSLNVKESSPVILIP